jgi:hypothetical protein
MHSHDLISVSVGEIRPNGEGNLSLILQAAAGEILPAYSAGAHIDIIIPGVGPRQYSLCGTPDRSNTYEICVRLTDASTGGSRYLHQQLKAGDRLAISPPRNHFPCRRPGATCCLPAVSASRLCWRWLKRLPPERGAGAALLCRQLAPDGLLPAPDPAGCGRHGGDSLQRGRRVVSPADPRLLNHARS